MKIKYTGKKETIIEITPGKAYQFKPDEVKNVPESDARFFLAIRKAFTKAEDAIIIRRKKNNGSNVKTKKGTKKASTAEKKR